MENTINNISRDASPSGSSGKQVAVVTEVQLDNLPHVLIVVETARILRLENVEWGRH